MSIELTLERDGHDQPWGFRLQGGVDVGLPLSVLRVLVGTPAESALKKGDIVTKISQTGTNGLSHQQAVDLFNKAGNQLDITVKRGGSGGVVAASSQPNVSALQATAAIRQQQQQQFAAQQPFDPSQSPQVAALPRTTFVLKSDLPATAAPVAPSTEGLSVQNQPYRTTPLVQPTAKSINELGVGTYSHLRLQEDICTGVREPILVPITTSQAQQLKANEFIMKQKTQQGLVNAASDHQKSGLRNLSPITVAPASGPIAGPLAAPLLPSSLSPPQAVAPLIPCFNKPSSPQPARYNSASGLYANQNSPKKPSATGMINPVNKPPNHMPFFALAKKYDPEQSATWQAIHEQENCQLITEHGPTESKVYSI